MRVHTYYNYYITMQITIINQTIICVPDLLPLFDYSNWALAFV